MRVRDRGEDDELDVYTEFKENIVRKHDGRYEANIPWIPGASYQVSGNLPMLFQSINLVNELWLKIIDQFLLQVF